MFVVLHWGHSRSPKVLILSFVQRQRLAALAGWPWYGADNYSPPCRPDEPHRKSLGERCQCPLHRHREKPMPAETHGSFWFPSTHSPDWGPQSAPCDRKLEAEILEWVCVCECVFVCVSKWTKGSPFILFICEITWRRVGRWCVCVCLLCLKRQEKRVYFLFVHIKGDISVCGHCNMFLGGDWAPLPLSVWKASLTGRIQER